MAADVLASIRKMSSIYFTVERLILNRSLGGVGRISILGAFPGVLRQTIPPAGAKITACSVLVHHSPYGEGGV